MRVVPFPNYCRRHCACVCMSAFVLRAHIQNSKHSSRQNWVCLCVKTVRVLREARRRLACHFIRLETASAHLPTDDVLLDRVREIEFGVLSTFEAHSTRSPFALTVLFVSFLFLASSPVRCPLYFRWEKPLLFLSKNLGSRMFLRSIPASPPYPYLSWNICCCFFRMVLYSVLV